MGIEKYSGMSEVEYRDIVLSRINKKLKKTTMRSWSQEAHFPEVRHQDLQAQSILRVRRLKW